MTYSVELEPVAQRALRKLERRDREAAKAVADMLSTLAEDPRPFGVRAMTGQPGHLRLRQGRFRIVYSVEDSRLIVHVVSLGYRRDVYR